MNDLCSLYSNWRGGGVQAYPVLESSGSEILLPVCNLNDFNRLYSLQIYAAHVFTIHFPF